MIYPNWNKTCWSQPGPRLLRTQVQITANASPSVNDGWSSSPDTDLQHVRSRPGETPDPYLYFGTGTHYLKCQTWTLWGKGCPCLNSWGSSSGPGKERDPHWFYSAEGSEAGRGVGLLYRLASFSAWLDNLYQQDLLNTYFSSVMVHFLAIWTVLRDARMASKLLFLDVFVRVFPEEVSMWIHRLSKDHLHQCGGHQPIHWRSD